MASQSPLTVTPSTTSAINRQVLKVSPETSVAEVIRRMSSGLDGDAKNSRASCAIVVDPSDVVLGIVTERDIVGLAAKQPNTIQSLTTVPVSTMMTAPVTTMKIEAFQDIFAVLFLFRRYRIRHLPIVDTANQLVGVVTPSSIRQILQPANLLKLRRVSDIMTTEVVQAPANVPVIVLAQLMAEHRVSCIIIVDTNELENGDESAICPPIGIVTERDIVQFKAAELDLNQIIAKEVMSAPLFLLDPQDSLWAAHEAMQEHKVRRLVVSWNWGTNIGIITQTSLLKVFDPIEMFSIIDSLQQTVKALNSETEADPVEQLSLGTQADADSKPENTVQGLLDQAVDCIEVATQKPQVSPLQKPLLQQAIQLIQQIAPTPSASLKDIPPEGKQPQKPQFKLL